MQNVLVLADQTTSLISLQYSLQNQDFKTSYNLLASDSAELVRQKNPQAIIVDVPEIVESTLTLLRQIKHFAPETYVIVLSKDNKNKKIQRVFTNGGDDFIAKPFHFAELISAVQTVLYKQFVRKVVQVS